MKIPDKEFSKLTFKIHGVQGDILKAYPILSDYGFSALNGDKNKDQIIKYIIYAFDRNSPLNTIPDVLQRRKVAAEIAELPVNKHGNYDERIEKMLFSQDSIINHLIIQYCIMQGSEEWMAYVVYSEALRNQSENLLQGKTDNEKTKELIMNIDTLNTKIKEVRRALLAENEDNFLRRSLYNFSESEKLALRPEDYARKLRGE